MTIKKGWFEKFETKLAEWLIAGFFTVISVGIVFYFNATHLMGQNAIDIKEVKEAVKAIDKTPSMNTLKIHQVKSEVQEIKESQKVLTNDFKDFQREYRADKDRIIDLLMQIKDEGDN